MSVKLSDLFVNGSIISLHCSIWRARTKLTASDLGIPKSDDVTKALVFGSHKLAPKNTFDAINTVADAAHRAVSDSTLMFAMIPGARYVPHQRLPELVQRLKAFREQFNTEAAQIAHNFGQIRHEMSPVIREALNQAAKTPEAAQTAFDRVMAAYPGSGAIREKFSLYWNIYTVQGSRNPHVDELMREEANQVRSIVQGMVEQTRKDVSEKLAAIMAIVGKGGRLKSRSLESALAVIDRAEQMNIMGDRVLTEQLANLRAALQGVDTTKDLPKEFADGLTAVRDALDRSVEQAVADAEASLTGLGVRKLA